MTLSISKLKESTLHYTDYTNSNVPIEFAKLIHNKFPIIYSGQGWQENCAFRLRSQLAENSNKAKLF